jgi:hypothetical protein
MNFGTTIKDGDFVHRKEDRCYETNTLLVVALIRKNGRKLKGIIIMEDVL